jgi:hypothetical protein
MEKPVGITTEGLPVWDIFEWYNSLGTPLDVILTLSEELEFTPDWPAFWRHACKEKWNPNATLAKLSEAVRESMGIEYFEQWLPRMKAAIIAGD